MCSTNNCRRFSRFTFTDFEWPACCTLCYSQGSSSHSPTCDASQGTCTTRGCQRRLNSDPLVGWHPVGERFCCVGCIDTAGTRHSATCDATLRSQNDIEPSASHANAPSRPAATLALTLMLSPLPLVPRILVVMLTTLATLTHGAPGTPALAGSGVSGVSLVPPTRCSLVLVLATSTFLSLSNADEQRLPQLPCVTIHVYDPADHFHTVYTVNQAGSGHASDPSHLVYGDSDSEAALFRSVYGAANHHEPDSETPHGPHAAQQGPGSPSTLDHPSTQLGDTLTHTVMPTSVDTPAYTSFLHGLLAQMQDETDSESDGSLVPDNWSSDDATPEPHQVPTFLRFMTLEQRTPTSSTGKLATVKVPAVVMTAIYVVKQAAAQTRAMMATPSLTTLPAQTTTATARAADPTPQEHCAAPGASLSLTRCTLPRVTAHGLKKCSLTFDTPRRAPGQSRSSPAPQWSAP